MVGRFAQRGMALWAALAGVTVPLWTTNSQPHTAPVSYHVTRYTTEHGLPQNTIHALLQTRDGYIWAGTLAGLARFDGVRFHVFNASNTPEMPHDAINALTEDRLDSSLWINTGNGLLRYHEHRFERFDEQHGYPQPLGKLSPAHGGGVWYSPAYGRLCLFQNGVTRSWQLRAERVSDGGDEIHEHYINHIEEESDGSVLVVMHNGLFRFVPATGVLTDLRAPSEVDHCRSVFRQSDGTTLLAGRTGLWRLREAKWEQIETVTPGDAQCPSRIHPSNSGDQWISWSDDGPPRIARFRKGRSEFLDLSKLPDYAVNEFLEDREGHLWLGTESGLCQLRPCAVRVYAREHGLRNDYVKSVTTGPDGTIWLGTDDGVSGIKDGQVTNLPRIEEALGWKFRQPLLADRLGRVWFGASPTDAVVFDNDVWQSPARFDLRKGLLRVLYEDRSGTIWVGFERGVAWMTGSGAVSGSNHDKTPLATLVPDPAGADGDWSSPRAIHELTKTLSHPDVRVIHQDRRGDLWFGTFGGGLNRMREGQITTYTTTVGDYNNRAWCIHEDANGVFWVGSQDGLNRFVPPGVAADVKRFSSEVRNGQNLLASTAATEKDGRFFTFSRRHGLHENVINNIQEDDFGCLWLSGLQGIYRVSRQELNAVAVGRQARAQVLAFGEADGMLNSECNGGDNQPSGCKDHAGCIWFPTARGVAVVDPRTIRRNAVPPPVVIEQAKADNEIMYGDGIAAGAVSRGVKSEIQSNTSIVTSDGTVHLAPGRARVLEIHYTANSFAAPHRMRFRYRLEGYDRNWHDDEDNRRAAYYTNLRPGAYAFRVTACNNHGVWSEMPAEFSFALAPHFWQTWSFYAMVCAGIVGLAAGVQGYRLRWQRRLLQTEQRQALADERTRIARDLHDDLGTALTGLALQIDVVCRAANEGDVLRDRLADSAVRIRALAHHMREVVWTINPSCDTVPSFASFLEQQAGQFEKADGLHCRLVFPEDIPPLPLDGETRHELALAVREAIGNVIRHAAASEIVLGLEVVPDQLLVRILDNGRGFRVAERQVSGHGLANMQARLKKIGGCCEYRSAPGAGTTIELRVPLVQAHLSRQPSRL